MSQSGAGRTSPVSKRCSRATVSLPRDRGGAAGSRDKLMRGRKPIPTDLHKLRGTLNTTRHGKGQSGEPEAMGDLSPEPPGWMSEGQQASWRYAVEHAPRGILRQIDRGILAVWVEAEERHRTAAMMQAQLDQGTKLPLLTKTKDGTAIASPYLGILNRAAAIM